MFAVVKTGGKQYKVRVGETIDVEKLAVEEGTQVQLDQVLLAANDGDVAYGRPLIDGAVVTARVVRQHRGPKLIVFRYKSKSRYRRRTGHRQSLTQLTIQSIAVPGWEVERVETRRAPAAVDTVPEASAAVPAAEATAPAPEASAAVPAAEATSPAPEAQAWGAVTTPEEAAPAHGSAAPPADVLPAIDPTAQVESADAAAIETTPGAMASDTLGVEPPVGQPEERLPESGAD